MVIGGGKRIQKRRRDVGGLTVLSVLLGEPGEAVFGIADQLLVLRGGRAHQHEGANAVGIGGDVLLQHQPAVRVSEKGCAWPANRFDDRSKVAGVPGQRVQVRFRCGPGHGAA